MEVNPFNPVILYGIKVLFVAAVGYGGLWTRRLVQRSRQNRAAGWPSVEGTVQFAKAEPVPKTRRFLVTLTYSYFVDEYRAGKYTHEFSREDDADEFARAMKDKRLQIRYRDSKRDESVIDQSIIEQYLQTPLRR